MHVVFSCQVLFDYYEKSKAELGVFPVNPHWTSSLSYRGLLNCEYNSLASWFFFFFAFSFTCLGVSIHSGNKEKVGDFAEQLRGETSVVRCLLRVHTLYVCFLP